MYFVTSLIFAVFLLHLEVQVTVQQNLTQIYCDYMCDKKVHTLCKAFKTHCSPPVRSCRKVSFHMTDEIRRHLIALHEDARVQVHSSDMRLPRWDKYLELVALCHANSLCKVQKDFCRIDNRHPDVGQNVGSVTYTAFSGDITNFIVEIFAQWMKGKGLLKNVNSYKMSSKTDEYAQIVNYNSNNFGCGVSVGEEPHNVIYLVCNYNNSVQSGNRLYQTGPPCLLCNATCSINLCGERDERLPFVAPPKELAEFCVNIGHIATAAGSVVVLLFTIVATVQLKLL